MDAKQKVIIDGEVCKGCGLCAGACPRKLIELDESVITKNGYHPARLIDNEKCVSCALCAVMCPDVAIKVIKFTSADDGDAKQAVKIIGQKPEQV